MPVVNPGEFLLLPGAGTPGEVVSGTFHFIPNDPTVWPDGLPRVARLFRPQQQQQQQLEGLYEEDDEFSVDDYELEVESLTSASVRGKDKGGTH